MSSEEAVHVSLMKVTPTSGKGTLGTWWFLRQARARLDKTEHINRSQGQERSYEQTIRRRGVRAPALEPRDEGEGSWTKCQGFKPDLQCGEVKNVAKRLQVLCAQHVGAQLGHIIRGPGAWCNLRQGGTYHVRKDLLIYCCSSTTS